MWNNFIETRLQKARKHAFKVLELLKEKTIYSFKYV